MSKSHLEMVRDFHVATSSYVAPFPSVPPDDIVRLRAKLILEEAFEVVGAMFSFPESQLKSAIKDLCEIIDDMQPNVSLANLAKELKDLEYVTLGANLAFGIPDAMFDGVHANNLTKVGGPVRADGKREKPTGYVKFDAARWLAENGGLPS